MRQLFKYAGWIWGVTTILAIALAYRVGYIVSSEETISLARAAYQRADSDMQQAREEAYQKIMAVSEQEGMELEACSRGREEARGMVSSCLRQLAECRGPDPVTAESR